MSVKMKNCDGIVIQTQRDSVAAGTADFVAHTYIHFSVLDS